MPRCEDENELEAFINLHHLVLNGCRVTRKERTNIFVALPDPSDENCTCRWIHPWYVDLEITFLVADFIKRSLIFYKLAPCNFNPTSFQFMTCFDRINNLYKVELCFQELHPLFWPQASS
ncbi:hypothetical protein ACFX2B_009190 [Malus domestica]